MTNSTALQTISKDEIPAGASSDIAGFLSILHEQGEVFEVRTTDCPEKRGGSFKAPHSGYFNAPDNVLAHIIHLDSLKPEGIYVTVNPVKPDLLARAVNRIQFRPKKATDNGDILRRNWLFIDIDSNHPVGVSATESEMQSALDLAYHMRDDLAADGWPGRTGVHVGEWRLPVLAHRPAQR